MTVFEFGNLTVQLASLAIQKEMLELQQASLALQEASLAVQRASVWVAAIVGAAKCIVAGHGLFVLHRDFNRYAEQHRKNMKEIERRHQETMASLKGQHETQKDQHKETMEVLQSQREAQSEQHRENLVALEGQNEALRELIRRTSAPSAPLDG